MSLYILLSVSVLANVLALVFYLAALRMWAKAKAGVTPQAYMAAKERTAIIDECAAFVECSDVHKPLDVIAANMRDLLNDPENAARIAAAKEASR